MATPTKTETVTVPREEYEELIRSNTQNTATVEELVRKLDLIQTAQLQGVGIDPAIAARALLPRTTVQFRTKYARSPIPSAIQKDALLIEGYSVAGGDIVHMRDDELKRINKEYPGLLITDKKDFTDKIVHRSEWKPDQQGRMHHALTERPIEVAVLLKNAVEVG